MIDQFLPGGAARGVGPLWATVGHCGGTCAGFLTLGNHLDDRGKVQEGQGWSSAG